MFREDSLRRSKIGDKQVTKGRPATGEIGRGYPSFFAKEAQAKICRWFESNFLRSVEPREPRKKLGISEFSAVVARAVWDGEAVGSSPSSPTRYWMS